MKEKWKKKMHSKRIKLILYFKLQITFSKFCNRNLKLRHNLANIAKKIEKKKVKQIVRKLYPIFQSHYY